MENKVVFTVKDVSAALGISLPKAYELVHSKNGPPVIYVGRCIRIPVQSFHAWVESTAKGE